MSEVKMWYNGDENHTKSSRAFERTCYPLRTCVRGTDTMPDHTTPSRTCSKCGETKPATTEYFYRSKTGKYGLDCYCKVCSAKYQRNYLEVNKERRRAYNIANAEKAAEYQRAYRAANAEEHSEKKRAYRARNAEHIAERNRNRRARELDAEGSHTTADIRAQYERQKGCCYYCFEKVGDNYHVDHVIPLSRGGSNGPENIVIACPFCNISKKDRLPSEWSRGGRLL